MTPILSKSPKAQNAYEIVKNLQHALVSAMDRIPPTRQNSRFIPVTWLRAQGRFGGGMRLMSEDRTVFNRASVNISQVQYEDDPSKKLGSASAISAIIHPLHPQAPSIHMHVSWTEMKDGQGYWRLMADLNPSIVRSEHAQIFRTTLQEAAGDLFEEASTQGDQYFYIPALGRHRGVTHFYLEQISRDTQQDALLAQNLGTKVIHCYADLIHGVLQHAAPPTAAEKKTQLEYHSLYFLQVLTLDRGTTSGLLVHDENDVGILGSLPSHVDKALLTSWIPRHHLLQQKLLKGILALLPDGPTSLVDDGIKTQLASWMRQFYSNHPEAQDLLARGNILPPTVANHLGASQLSP